MYGFNQMPFPQPAFGAAYPPPGMVLPLAGGSMDQLQMQANAMDPIPRVRSGGSMDQLQIEASRVPVSQPDICITFQQGLGLHLAKKPNGDLVVTSTKPGGSAAEAGIRAGTVIFSVDGHYVQGREPREVRDFIVGPEGTEVVLDIEDPKTKQRMTVACLRRAVAPQAPQTPPTRPLETPQNPQSNSRVREWLQRNDAPTADEEEIPPQRESIEAEVPAVGSEAPLQPDVGSPYTPAGENGYVQQWTAARKAEGDNAVERLVEEKVLQFKQELLAKISEDDAMHKSKLQEQVFSLTQMISSAVADFNEIRTDVQKDLEHIQHLENRIASLTAQVDTFMKEGKDTHTADFAYM